MGNPADMVEEYEYDPDIGLAYSVKGRGRNNTEPTPYGLYVEPAYSEGPDRQDGRSVFLFAAEQYHKGIFITPDEAMALAICLMRVAAQERARAKP